jgi:hypothetical protein
MGKFTNASTHSYTQQRPHVPLPNTMHPRLPRVGVRQAAKRRPDPPPSPDKQSNPHLEQLRVLGAQAQQLVAAGGRAGCP